MLVGGGVGCMYRYRRISGITLQNAWGRGGGGIL